MSAQRMADELKMPDSTQQGLEVLDKRLKDAIQTLFFIQSGVHGYAGPETHQHLVAQIQSLQPQLAALSLDSLPDDLSKVTPEILNYMDDGRNPDIYTRQFVELVLSLNAYVKGRTEGYAEFRDVLAEEIVRGLGSEMQPLVDRAVGRVAPLDQLAAASGAQLEVKPADGKEKANGV